MRGIRIFSLWAGVWFLLASFVWAQDFERFKHEIIDSAWMHSGSFYLSSAFVVSNAGYNSNIFAYENAEEGDTTADVGLELMAGAIFKDMLIVQFKETPVYSYYVDNQDQRVMNNHLQLNVVYKVGRLGILYRFDRPRLSSRPNTEFGARLQHLQKNHFVSVDLGRRDRFFINMYTEWRNVEYQAERYLGDFSVDELFGRKENWYGFSLNRVSAARSRIALNVEYFDVNFTGLPDRNKTGGQASATVAVDGAQGLTGSLQLGYRFVFPQSKEFKDYSRLFGIGNMEYRIARRFRLRVQYLLDTRYSFFSTDLVYDESSVGLGLEFNFAPGVSLGYISRLGRRDYRSLSGLEVDRVDNYHFATFTLTVAAFVHLELGLSYNIVRSDSNVERFDMRADSLGFFMRYEF